MKRATVFLVGFSMILALSPTVGAQSQSTATEDGSTELTITVKHDVIKVGDPITLHITMKNMHKDKYCHHVENEELQAWRNGYHLEATDSEGHVYPLRQLKRPRAGSISGECIDHGKSTSETMDVNRIVDLSNPGIYHLRVSHVDEMTHEKIWSNTIAITVQQ